MFFSEFPKIRNKELISKSREVSRDIKDHGLFFAHGVSRLREPLLSEVSRRVVLVRVRFE
jgi:hypothetical protein